MKQKSDKRIFILYLTGFIVLAISLMLFQPLANTPPLFGNPPDEHARYLIPRYICEHGVIPTGLEEEVRIPAYGFSYALYNAFPYIIQGGVMRLVSCFTASEVILLYSARMVNVVFGVLMAVVVYLIGRRLFSDRRFGWLFCFAVMYLPQSLFLHTYVNTDSCCMLSTAMMIYGWLKCYKDGISRSSNLWMSGGIILCALSYYNAYGYILSSILLFLVYFWTGRKKKGGGGYDWQGMLKNGTFVAVIVLLGISWWFIRSLIVLDGDLLGLATRQKMAEQYAIESVNPLYMQTYQDRGYSVWEMIQEQDSLEGAFASFVAAYGSMSILGRMGMYRLYKLFFGAGLLGCIYYACTYRGRRRMSGHSLFLHANMIFCIFMPLFLMLYYAYTTDYQHQGRYLMPALIPLMYYTVKGVEWLARFGKDRLHFPRRLINAGVFLCFLLIILGTLDMIYIQAMPVYLTTGMVLS